MELVEFWWERGRPGAEWITGKDAAGSPCVFLSTGPSRALSEAFARILTLDSLMNHKLARREARAEFYQPLQEHTGLFRTLAELTPEPEAICSFVERYGPLGIEESFFVPKKGNVSGESLTAWVEVIDVMRRAVGLWDALVAVKEGYDDLTEEEVLSRVADGYRRVAPLLLHDTDTEGQEEEGSSGASASEVTFTLRNPSYLKRAPEMASTMEARFALAGGGPFRRGHPELAWFLPSHAVLIDTVDQHLRTYASVAYASLSPRKVGGGWGEAVEASLHITASSLLGALWLQFARAIDGERKFKPCERCGEWFEVSPGVARSDRAYCGDSCKGKAARERRKRRQRGGNHE